MGTTHTVVAYADLKAAAASPKPTPAKEAEDGEGQGDKSLPIHLFAIEQLIAPGAVAARPLLPSVRYHPADGELAAADRQLSWPFSDPGEVADVVLGELARERGSRTPGRLVASAKSWLSHAGVDRTAPILPWGAAAEIPKVSPVAASAGTLAHIRAAWNHRFPRQPLERQELVLTVPASFDEAARALTVEAARLAGLPQLRLLEEPQAACYDWLHRHRADVTAALGDACLLLVCDVGGGTTDLTLIQIAPGAAGPELTRIGVGDHLMLGGDNMDLALARIVESRLGGKRLNAGELSQLLQQCRSAKEHLLATDAPERVTVTVLGGGARLIDGELVWAVVRMLAAAAVAALAVVALRPLCEPWLAGLSWEVGRRAADALGWLAVGGTVFVLAALLLRLPEAGRLVRSAWSPGRRRERAETGA